jgi:hypothetical protein
MPPATARLEEHKQITRTVPLILIIVALGLPWLSCLRLPHFPDQLLRTLIETHHGKACVIGLSIEIQHVLHAPDKFPADSRDTPRLL